MDTGKNQQHQKSMLKLTFFAVLIILTVFCIIQNAKASETSGEVMNKLANEVTDGNSVEESFNVSLSPEDRKYIAGWKAAFPQYVELTDFVTQEMRFGVSYRLVKGMFSSDKLPLLYQLLDDESYVPYWGNIAKVIGFISEDPNTVPILLKYIQRNDGDKVNWLNGKIWILCEIGKIGGKEADSILRKAITKEGARELVKDWVDEELWQDKVYDSNGVILIVRNAAVKGLINTCKPENWKIVEDIIENVNNENKDIAILAAEALSVRDFIVENDNDIEAFYRVEVDRLPGVITKYYKKYREKIK
ncbi:MAG: hypothetical protein JW787_15000 [Sedimentisphaerales bacterium]|nr:hypothetical protein [Sedimentisphaerales bacterium]